MHLLRAPHQQGNAPRLRGNVHHARSLFGDLNDPESDISKKLAASKTETLYPDLGLSPHVYYIGLDDTLAMPVASAVHKGGNVLRHYEG